MLGMGHGGLWASVQARGVGGRGVFIPPPSPNPRPAPWRFGWAGGRICPRPRSAEGKEPRQSWPLGSAQRVPPREPRQHLWVLSLPAAPALADRGRLGCATILRPLGQDPALGLTRGLVAFRNCHTRRLQATSTKNDKKVRKSTSENARICVPSFVQPPGAGLVFPHQHSANWSPPATNRQDQPPVPPPSPPKPAALSPPPSALPGPLTLAGSLLWALSGLDSGRGTQGHSVLYNVPEREVAPPGRWSSSALAGPILPKASPRTSKGLQD